MKSLALLTLSTLTLASPLSKSHTWCTFFKDSACAFKSHRTNFDINNPGVFTSNDAHSVVCHSRYVTPEPDNIWAVLVGCGDDQCENEGERMEIVPNQVGLVESPVNCVEIGDEMRAPYWRFNAGLHGPGVF